MEEDEERKREGRSIEKCMFTQYVQENVAVLSHDNYYRHRPHLTVEERDNINFDHPDSLETELMVQHLQVSMSMRRPRMFLRALSWL